MTLTLDEKFEKRKRRMILIDKQDSEVLTPEEQQELDSLQALFDSDQLWLTAVGNWNAALWKHICCGR